MGNIAKEIDPVLIAILSKKFDAVINRMINTLLRSGRSVVLNTARDFSCSITDSQGKLVCVGEGLPVHVGSSGLTAKAMIDLFDDIRPGDAFLNNSPYYGNTHHADHTILVPVFYEGEHIFTTLARAHQADVGNSLPTTYTPYAKDLYEEGALDFPCIRVRRDYKDIKDIIRMARMRIRVPDQWYGDYLAQVGACLIAEREIVGLCDKYGIDTVKLFVEAWQGYGRRSMMNAIRKLPKGTWHNETKHDPFAPVAPDGITVRLKMTIDPEKCFIYLDFTESDDCVPGGLNMCEGTVIASGSAGVLYNLDPNIPHNDGAMSRIKFILRDNCVAGPAKHPVCASLATTNVADRMVNVVQSCFVQLGNELGLADGALGMPASCAVINGTDWRAGGAPYANQLVLGIYGGPGLHGHDGWLTYGIPVCGGVLYLDSIELDEQRFPLLFTKMEIIPDSVGAGKWRGAPGSEMLVRPRRDPGSFAFVSDGHFNVARGVAGGFPGGKSDVWKYVTEEGSEKKTELPKFSQEIIEPNEVLVSQSCGGGGYGNPLERDPEKVREDAREGYITVEKAREIYGVVLDTSEEKYKVQYEATNDLRKRMSDAKKG